MPHSSNKKLNLTADGKSPHIFGNLKESISDSDEESRKTGMFNRVSGAFG